MGERQDDGEDVVPLANPGLRRYKIGPMPSGLGTPQTNLPAQLTTFIGRDAQRAELLCWLSAPQSTTRLITLTGIGGVGKTRLALEVAGAVPGTEFPHGVWLAEL